MPAIRMGRAALEPIEIPKMACLERPDVRPLPLELFALFPFVSLLSLSLLLLLLLLPLLVPPGLLLPPSKPGVAGFHVSIVTEMEYLTSVMAMS